MTLKVIKTWHTQDGEYFHSAKLYSPPADIEMSYPRASCPPAGADHHILVKAPIGSLVTFNTEDGTNLYEQPATAEKNGWVDLPMSKSSAYWPDDGQHGTWIVWVNGVEVGRGYGLINNWHVSTFLVVEDEVDPVISDPTSPVLPPLPAGSVQYVELVVRTRRDDVVVREEVVWRSR